MDNLQPHTRELIKRGLIFLVAFVLTGTGAFSLALPLLIVERWAGFVVVVLLILVFLERSVLGRIKFRHPWAIALGLIAALALLVPASFLAQIYESGFDDGPFLGRPYLEDITALEPDHSVAYRSGELRIYNRTDDEMPVLAYVSDHRVEWALILDVTTNPRFSHTYFRSVSGPVSVSQGIARDRLDFIAHWSYGAEHGYVYIWKFGGVQRFYLSW